MERQAEEIKLEVKQQVDRYNQVLGRVRNVITLEDTEREFILMTDRVTAVKP